MKILSWLVRIALFLIVLSFAVRNTESVVVRWLPGLEIQLPLVLALLAAFLLGLLAAWLILLPSWMKARRDNAKASKALARAEKTQQNSAALAHTPTAPKTAADEPPASQVGPTHGI